MTDILTHVLAGFVLGTVMSFRLDWLRGPFITIVMLGAVIPDFTKISMIISSEYVESLIGLPFDWFAFHTPFGAVITAGIGALLIDENYRVRVFGLLLTGAASHFVLDALLMNPSRFSYVLLWPFVTVLTPLPMYLLSSDQWPAILATGAAAAVWYVRRRADGKRLSTGR